MGDLTWQTVAIIADIHIRTKLDAGCNDMTEIVSSAILAERQRCADVAKAYLEDLAGCDLGDDEPDLIAAAILNPT
jgi:hypothetical protein